MFVVSLSYKKPIVEVEKHIPEHAIFLDKFYALNKIIFSGRKNPRTGGVILVHNCTREELDDIIKQDPFYKHQIADYDITEVIPTKYVEGFKTFVEQQKPIL
jgi:uncharacterized protein YciI